MTGTKEASALTLAGQKIERAKSYQQSFGLSSRIVKELLGVLLLRLAAGQAEPSGWELFGVLLRAFYEQWAVGF